MPQSNTPERTLLERDKSLCHDRMQKAWDDLCEAVSKFHSLENHYDLSEQTIESADGWVYRMDETIHDVGKMIEELEVWAFDGDSYNLMEDADETE